MRPASSAEVVAKHILEMRPSRKRMREGMRHPDEPVQAGLPFEDDLLMMFNERDQEQPSYVELPLDLPAEGGPPGVAGEEEIPVPAEIPGPIEIDDAEMEEEEEEEEEEEQVPVPEQPESGMAPSPTTPQSVEPPVGSQPQPEQDQSLTTALREGQQVSWMVIPCNLLYNHHLDFL